MGVSQTHRARDSERPGEGSKICHEGTPQEGGLGMLSPESAMEPLDGLCKNFWTSSSIWPKGFAPLADCIAKDLPKVLNALTCAR